jgi:hypothetical protein
LAAAVPCFADTATVNGVLAEERVINLPNDQGKWYISVVGSANDTAYLRLLGWFDSNTSLKVLKSQVRFCPVTTGHPMYQERYASNVKGLPTVRVQKANGEVVYEAAGKNIPMTVEGLYGAIASGVHSAQGIRCIPWRRCPQPSPGPQPDPDTQPIDDGEAPIVEPQPESALPPWVLAMLCVVGFLGGLSVGYGRQLYAKLHPAVK